MVFRQRPKKSIVLYLGSLGRRPKNPNRPKKSITRLMTSSRGPQNLIIGC